MRALGLALIAAVALALGGCGTTSKRGAATTDASKASPRPGTAAPPGRGGGYYLDDGPGAHPPANLDEIADAVPRVEAIHRATSRPYSVMGKAYAPMSALAPYRERGMATWYGRRYHGKPTSSGEIYDMYAMSAAHTTLPIPSYARVTHLGNGRSVIVRINDRGPFVGDRLIDLSYVAAHKLDIVRTGSAWVEVETILPSAEGVYAAAPRPSLPARPAPQPSAPASQGDAAEDAPVIAARNGHYLQLGAFTLKENAERFLERLRGLLDALQTPLAIAPSGGRFAILAGPYAARAEAAEAALAIEALLGAAPIIAAPR